MTEIHRIRLQNSSGFGWGTVETEQKRSAGAGNAIFRKIKVWRKADFCLKKSKWYKKQNSRPRALNGPILPGTHGDSLAPRRAGPCEGYQVSSPDVPGRRCQHSRGLRATESRRPGNSSSSAVSAQTVPTATIDFSTSRFSVHVETERGVFQRRLPSPRDAPRSGSS